MPRLLAVVLALCAVSGPCGVEGAEPQSSFQGQIVDADRDAPVEGATVSIVGAVGSARTDREGRFVWRPAPAVPFQVIVILPGGQVAKPILVERVDAGVTTLAVSSLADETVTVLGAAPSVDAAPASGTTLLSGSQIASRSPEHLMQALETVPGISQVSEGHAAVPAVRGLARGRTLILIDGARVTSERRVGPSAAFSDPASLEGIDVARGPGSVAYGSDALGGVISLRTRRAEPGSGLRARFTGTLGGGIPDRRASLEVSQGLARGGVLLQARIREADDYDSPKGDVFNSGWDDRGFLVNFQHQLARGLVTAGWQSDLGRDVERPRNNSRTVRFYYPFEDSHRFTASYVLPEVGGFQQIAVMAFLGAYDQRTDQDRYATPTTGRSIERADVSANDFHVKGIAARLLGNARVEFGMDVNGRFDLEALDSSLAYSTAGTVTRDTTTVSIEDARRTDTGAFAEIEAALGPRARVGGGVRIDYVATRNTGGYFGDRSTSHVAGSGFGSLTVGPFGGFSLTGQLARGFRDPTLSDRYFRGPSGRGFITGNPDLDPESSVQADVAVRYALPRTQLAVYFYEYRIHDLIERYQTDPDYFYFRNRGRARLRGVEAEVRASPGHGFSVEFGAQLAHGVALDDGASLDDIAPPTLSVTGRKDFGGRGYGLIRAAAYAEDDRPGPSEVRAPGAVVMDAGAGWRLASPLEVRLTVRNLLDQAYYASPDPRWVYAPGRSASVTAVVTFQP